MYTFNFQDLATLIVIIAVGLALFMKFENR
jgi:hypothetical protein